MEKFFIRSLVRTNHELSELLNNVDILLMFLRSEAFGFENDLAYIGGSKRLKIVYRFIDFAAVGIPLAACGYIMDRAILNSIIDRWASSDRGKAMLKISPWLDKRSTADCF